MAPRRTARSGAPQRDLSTLYDEHVWGVYGFFGYHRLPRSDIEDLTQATFERAIRAWPRYDPLRAGVRTWLIAIAQNLLIDHHRRERSRRHSSIDAGLDESLLGVSAGPDERFELSPRLAAALSNLSERERQVIALRFGADLSGPEIAELLSLSLANVQQISSRALRKLRGQLEQDRAQADAGDGGEMLSV